MKFNYLDYKDDIFERVYKDNEKENSIIFVYSDEYSKMQGLKKYGDYFLFEDNLHFTIEELKEEIFLTDRVLLREEKRVVAFYRALSRGYKKENRIDNYFDIIDIANNFFNFYKELGEAEIEFLEELSPWQKKIYKDFEKIKLDYQKFLDEKKLEDRIFLYSKNRAEYSFVSKYEKIIFINTIEFTKLEKSLIENIKKSSEIEFYLKMKSGDFDEGNLKIDKITFPDKDFEIEIKECSDGIIQYMTLIDDIKENEDMYKIFDPLFSSYDYNGFLSRDYFRKNRRVEFSKSEIFKFLSYFYELVPKKDEKTELDSMKLLKAMQNKFFRRYFGLSEDDYYKTLDYLNNGYKYFDLDKIEFNYLVNVFNEIEIIKDLNSIDSISEYFENIDINIFDIEKYSDIGEHYYSSIFELRAIENLNLVDSWSDFFDKGDESRGIFRLFLKYLRFKKLKLKENRVGLNEIGSLDDVGENRVKNIYILNASEGIIDRVKFNGFLLNDRQRENLGLKTAEKERKRAEYNFYKIIFAADKIIISGIKNISKNIDFSPFIEKLIMTYSLKKEKSEFSDSDYSAFSNELFEFEKRDFILKESIDFKKDDIENFKLSLGYYDMTVLKSCEYKYFLSSVLKIEELKKEISQKLEAKDLGILIHDLLEMLSKDKKTDIFNGDFGVDRELIQKDFETKLYKYRYKMPKKYRLYYHEILFPILKNGIENFYRGLEQILKDEKIVNYYSEKSSEEKDIINDSINFVAKARADLRIETDKNSYIIDYKTGQGSTDQLNFYRWLYYDQDEGEDYIYSVTDSKFEKAKVKVFDEDEIKEIMLEILRRGGFNKTDRKRYCKVCEYFDICRPR